ncbi:MAG: GNAT family N-acetyltransferase [Bacteroidetes bacterium]|nr:GNAT family N-acetyltransferase [Bacteroidota bacterium]
MEIILKDLKNQDDIHKFKDVLTEFYDEIEHDKITDNELLRLITDFINKGIIKVAIYNNEIIGFISLIESYAIYASGKYGVINELYVKPHFRSKGIGEKLMLYANQLKEIKEWSRLELSPPEESKWKRTLNFYLKEGFNPTGVRMKK